ncbi:hypothetical protein Mal4_50790 [Maioricimonas rarisocia]|uniref:Zinc-finger domain-containing protein n=1 Tax=Maioricimonas rarisocia TaxID=2528026 RepID=A0A517ZE37_9PLAN|nr:hypothetical protein [Maioricimonas rarisocia]QDU40719.1 hypothetical protein Mal4_50790 [Maioricimonas rarisocia]
MTTDRDDNLTWLAYQYVANELDAAQRAEFEARLADDQAARDALADLVLIHEAVGRQPATGRDSAIPATQPLTREQVIRGTAPRFGSQVIVTSAAALALLVVVSLLLRDDPAIEPVAPVVMTPARTIPTDGDPSSLIVLWQDLHADQFLVDGDAAGLVDESAPAADEIPDWMFLALDASVEAAPDLDDMDDADGPWPADPAEERL